MAQDAEWMERMQTKFADLTEARENVAISRINASPASSSEILITHQWKAHQGQVSSLATHPFAANKVISAGYDKKILVWESSGQSHKIDAELYRHGNVVSKILALDPSDGKGPNFYLLSSSWDGACRISQVPKTPESSERFLKGPEARTIPPTKAVSVADCQTSTDLRQVYVLPMLKSKFYLFNMLGDLKYTFDTPSEEAISALACGKKHTYYALWESYTVHALIASNKLEQVAVTNGPNAPKSPVVCMVVHPNDDYLVVCTSDGVISLYDSANLTFLRGFSLQDQTKKIALSPKNPKLLAAVGQQGLAVLNTETQKSYWTKGKKAFVSLCWSCDGQTIYCGTTDGSVVVCPLPDTEDVV